MKCEKHGTVMPMVCGEAKCGMCFVDMMETEGVRMSPPKVDMTIKGFGLTHSVRSGTVSKNRGK